MANTLLFFVNSVMLGLGLAMDAFSVSLANGFADTKMSRRRKILQSDDFSLDQEENSGTSRRERKEIMCMCVCAP